MLEMTDTFIKYLESKLASDPPVHWRRATTDDELSQVLKFNALNVSILGWYESGSMEEALVSLDVLGSDERTIVRWVQRVRDVLIETLFTPEFDYATTPGIPIKTGRSVKWNMNDISFTTRGVDAHTLHVNATFPISHARK